jgi:hypothetical protein
MLAAVTIPHGPQATLGSSCHSRGRAWKSSGLCIYYAGIPKWTTGTVCKTAGSAFVGSNPTLSISAHESPSLEGWRTRTLGGTKPWPD